eukprot:3026414-Rhodomonas_salina.1
MAGFAAACPTTLLRASAAESCLRTPTSEFCRLHCTLPALGSGGLRWVWLGTESAATRADDTISRFWLC